MTALWGHPKRSAGPLLIFNLAGLNLSVQRLNGRLAMLAGAPACVFPDRGITRAGSANAACFV